ncbi:sulfurtransferase [Candidatus Leptofilum sp.]|uniref:sulfurtransferase n=1 Tax=Candidatus Leptofilum sp. TaxID=3241576 RepID=UPI003B597290
MNRNSLLIEADELLAKIDDPNLRIYDATILFFRGESGPTAHEEYLEAHIPGAAFFDHQDFSDASSKYMYMVLPEADLAKQIGNIGIGDNSEVIFYTTEILACATRAWWVLRYAGHNNVRVLNGGLDAWKKAGGQLESGERKYETTTFTSNLRTDMFANKEDVLAAMQNEAVCTVNTLPPNAYYQSHIQGSSHLSCLDLMRDNTAFVDNDTLTTRLHEEAQHERVITYCGGGIAATVNAMAHLMAGNQNVAVYDGSMDEWAGEGLPMTSNG